MPAVPRRIAELIANRELVYHLVTRDLRVRYKRSAFGVLWAFAEPLFLMTLFTVVFSFVLRVDSPNYPLFVLCGIIVWGFFNTGVTYSLSSISANSSLVKKIYFPREILPMSLVIGRLVHFVLSLVLLVPFFVYFRVVPSVHVVYLPLLILIQLCLVLGLSLLLSALATMYDDVAFLVTFVFTGMFYVSPVLYPVSMVPEAWRSLFLLNPMAGLITAYRAVLLEQSAPPWDALGPAAALALAGLAAGYFVFKRLEWAFAEVL